MSLYDKLNNPRKVLTASTSSTGSNGNATNNGGGFTAVSSGLIGQGYSQASGNYEFANNPVLGNEWSFNFWCKPVSAIGNDYFIQFQGADSGSSSVFYMYNHSTQGLNLSAIDSTGIRLSQDASNNEQWLAFTNGSWNMITLVWDNTAKQLRTYKNGVLYSTSKVFSHTSAGNFGTPNRTWIIGNYNGGTGSNYASRATNLDEWSWWSGTLSQADITELYNSGSGIKANTLSSANSDKLMVYYDFEDSPNGTLTNQAGTAGIDFKLQKQRFVENFSGSALDTDRWEYRNVTGSGTGAMADSVDDGYEIKPSSGGADQSQIDFNGIKQYSPTGCAMISVAKSSSVSANHHVLGLINNHLLNISSAQTDSIIIDTSAGNFRALSGDNGTWSSAGTVISNDTNFHVFKVEASSSNILYYADGLLRITKTTNRPTLKLQPRFVARYASSTLSVRYAEVYNT